MTTSMSFAERATNEALPALGRYLLSLISIKRTTLCVSADVHTTAELLRLAEEVGDAICVLKTHVDIIDDFGARTIAGLKEIAQRKHFLIFEDRKFGDIGNTVQSQYARGPLRIAQWAHLTNAHLLPGPAIIPAMRTAALSALASVNQSTTTTISTGTPRLSFDSDTDPFAPGAVQTISESSEPNPPPPVTTQSADFESGASRSASQAGANPSTTGDNRIMFRHHRTSSSGKSGGPSALSATTTISQTYETMSPPTQPPALLKQLSSTSIPHDFESEAVIDALESLGPPPHSRGLLLLAQMSSAGNLMTKDYTKACVDAAHAHKDFVLGFVSQENLNRGPEDDFITFTPGVSLPPESSAEDAKGMATGDGKGQQYRTPEMVVETEGVDIIIVGRGILAAEDREREAQRYRRRAWRAYERRIHPD